MRIFFYGTLMDPDVRRLVFGARGKGLRMRPARLPGFRRVQAKDADYPVLVRSRAAFTEGELVTGWAYPDLLPLFHFEGPDFLPFNHLVIDHDKLRSRAWVLLPANPSRAGSQPWDLRRWQLRDKPRLLLQLRSWMREFERMDSDSVDIVWPVRRQLKAWRESGRADGQAEGG